MRQRYYFGFFLLIFPMLINFHPYSPTLCQLYLRAHSLSQLFSNRIFHSFLFGFSNICVFIMYALHIKTSQIDMYFTIIFSVFLAFLSIFSPSCSTSSSLQFALSLFLSLISQCVVCVFLFDVISLYFLFLGLSLPLCLSLSFHFFWLVFCLIPSKFSTINAVFKQFSINKRTTYR